jgi:hypothetical protein
MPRTYVPDTGDIVSIISLPMPGLSRRDIVRLSF